MTFEHPYLLAPRLSTLDHLTKGRVACNEVSSYLPSAARNIGMDRQIGHDARYDLAEEYMEVAYNLWEGSWEEGAVLRDKERGIFTDAAKVHPIRHQGEYFKVPGFHLCERSCRTGREAGVQMRRVQIRAMRSFDFPCCTPGSPGRTSLSATPEKGGCGECDH
ncbi:LLM class flavin-dependent oxidoreductase [Pseudooceanicola sp. CBS1P-1]|uniref:LLM class flavin-dependent oxidoreductase n=1 Tax=Pseudooceanicola TaxID=1679449 RepID=UPI00192520F0|nr:MULTISPECIES: LLM class flavin-dependent oxidoreductase [Pseudooceanicola]MBT9386890.1 LLM class flavin-dependent oxidoreductase [Pseudooceanicola endophyticus]